VGGITTGQNGDEQTRFLKLDT